MSALTASASKYYIGSSGLAFLNVGCVSCGSRVRMLFIWDTGMTRLRFDRHVPAPDMFDSNESLEYAFYTAGHKSNALMEAMCVLL